MALGEGQTIVFASNIFGDVALYGLPWEHVRGITDGLVARAWRVIRYDVRGMGSSTRSVADMSLEARVKDLKAVVEAAGLERFVLGGVDFGAPTAVAFAAEHPAFVSHLVLVSPWARGVDRFALPGARVATTIKSTADQDWRFATRAISSIATDFADLEPGKARELAGAIQQSTSSQILAEHRQASLQIDVSDYLRQVTTPTLVIHDPYFEFGSLDLCRSVAASLVRATLVVVDENSVAGDQHDSCVEVMDQFLRHGSEGIEDVRQVRPVPSEVPVHGLTARESEVLSLVADGLSNKEIAARLTLAVPTVERHLVNVYAKIGARGRADATTYAWRHGLTTSPWGEKSTRFP
jgi:pimeloyl-ACP methyl ester carboxylesterase/DNA-binding CsgD family transcriptional regulator